MMLSMSFQTFVEKFKMKKVLPSLTEVTLEGNLEMLILKAFVMSMKLNILF